MTGGVKHLNILSWSGDNGFNLRHTTAEEVGSHHLYLYINLKPQCWDVLMIAIYPPALHENAMKHSVGTTEVMCGEESGPRRSEIRYA